MRKVFYLFVILFVALLAILTLPTVFAADNIPIEETNSEEEVMLDDEGTETVINDHTKLSENRYFDLTLERGPQTAFGQYVPYIITITPHLESPETQIIWNMPTTLEAYPKHSEFVSLEKDQTYSFEGRVKPLKGGIYDFSISVISWQYNTNYTNTVGDNVVFNDKLVLQPVSSFYQWMNILQFGLIFLVFAVAVFITILIVKKYTKKAKKWLTPPSW
jgi:hypothetical protein